MFFGFGSSFSKEVDELSFVVIFCDTGLINLRTLKPIDRDAIVKSVSKTHRVVCVEEGWPQSGIGAGTVTLLLGFGRLSAAVWCYVINSALRLMCSSSTWLLILRRLCTAEIVSIVTEEAFDELDAPPERITGAEVIRS